MVATRDFIPGDVEMAAHKLASTCKAHSIRDFSVDIHDGAVTLVSIGHFNKRRYFELIAGEWCELGEVL